MANFSKLKLLGAALIGTLVAPPIFSLDWAKPASAQAAPKPTGNGAIFFTPMAVRLAIGMLLVFSIMVQMGNSIGIAYLLLRPIAVINQIS